MFKQLRNKFLLLNMVIISIVMLMAFIIIYSTTYNNLYQENQSKLKSIVFPMSGSVALPSISAQTLDGEGIQIIKGGILPDYLNSFSLLLTSKGELYKIGSYIDMPDEVYYKAAEQAYSGQKEYSTISAGDKKWMYKIAILKEAVANQNGTVTVNEIFQFTFLNVTESSQTLSTLLITFILVGAAMLIVIFGVSLYFANRAIKPISETWDKQKQFVADASHELKTPLTIINANADALAANKTETIESQQKWLNYIQIQTERMNKLISDLLYLARTEDTETKIEFIPFNISDTVNDIILQMEPLAYEKGITITHSIDPDLIVKNDCERVKQVIVILFDNAIKYTSDNGKIDITLKKEKHHIAFHIKNTGAGLSKEEISKIFDRFYRSDKARTYENGSYGLGLSIAKTIIDRLGGKISARSSDDENIFSFTLNP